MDYHKLQIIRASILQEVNEFVPEGHYSDDTLYGVPQGSADYNIGRILFSPKLVVTARQASALNVLMTVGLYAMTDGELAACRAARLKLTHENAELEADYNLLLSDRNHFEQELCVFVEQYAQHLPDIESKAILFLIKDNTAVLPPAKNDDIINNITIPAKVEKTEDAGGSGHDSSKSENIAINTDCNCSGQLKAPKKQDDWFDAIDDMTQAYVKQRKCMPKETQAWSQLVVSPPDGYEITIDKDSINASALKMPGATPLSRDSFSRRWKKYTR